jgi:hypothetical protein
MISCQFGSYTQDARRVRELEILLPSDEIHAKVGADLSQASTARASGHPAHAVFHRFEGLARHTSADLVLRANPEGVAEELPVADDGHRAFRLVDAEPEASIETPKRRHYPLASTLRAYVDVVIVRVSHKDRMKRQSWPGCQGRHRPRSWRAMARAGFRGAGVRPGPARFGACGRSRVGCARAARGRVRGRIAGAGAVKGRSRMVNPHWIRRRSGSRSRCVAPLPSTGIASASCARSGRGDPA